MATGTLSRVVTGAVFHNRLHPVENRFRYPVFFLLLNLDHLQGTANWLFGVNRSRPVAFHFADHGDGRAPGEWIGALLADAGINDCAGPIWVQAFPRIFGYCFNPVSFWYCSRADGTVGAVVAEVNNTFGERHCYLLRPDPETGKFIDVRAEKRLFVSPFYPLDGHYLFRFNLDFDAPRVVINYFQGDQLQLNTAVFGHSRPLSTTSLLSVMLRQPLLTLGVIIKIHWQALRLWIKGVDLLQRPAASKQEPSP